MGDYRMNKLTNEQKEHLEMLCQALESGEYKQGRGDLKQADTDEFCCLGVACDIFKNLTGKGKWDGSCFLVDRYYFKGSLVDYSSSGLEGEIRDFFGFTGNCGFNVDGEVLTVHNDGRGGSFEGYSEVKAKTFPEIAQLIRKYVAEN